jgi:quinol monooxygenase YgiN
MEKIFAFARFAIKPGHTEAFIEKARASMRAAVPDLKGAQLYEWFYSADSNTCMVIESYDGLEAIAHHGKTVGATIPSLLEHAASDVTLLGDVPQKMVAGMGRVFDKVSYFGARMQGKLNAPAPGKVGSASAGAIYAIARFRILPAKAPAFRDLASRIFTVVDEREPGTLGYEWFMNADDSECMVLDIYRDMDALNAHRANVGAMMAGMKELVTSEVELYGAIPADVQAALAKAPGTRYVGSLLQGIL